MTHAAFLLLCDPDGRIRRIVHDRLGLDPNEWLGRPFTMLVVSSACDRALDFLQRVKAEGAQYYWHMPVLSHDRVMLFLGAVEGDRILVAAGTSPEDIDALVDELDPAENGQAEFLRRVLSADTAVGGGAMTETDCLEDLARLNNQFANLQRELARKNVALALANTRKSQMLGMAAHDLRNPLQAISGFAAFLHNRAGDRLDDKERRFLEHIAESSAFMKQLIEDLLEYSRAETGLLRLDREDVDLNDLVNHVVELHSGLAHAKDIHLIAGLADAPLHAWLDRQKMLQVLDNLIGNAIKFSPPGRSVRVAVAPSTDDGDCVTLSVSDEGPGIPEEEMDKLFKPFSTTSVKPTGGEISTGLGLAITKNIVEGHGGTIGVESAPGKGSAFIVVLPVKLKDGR